MQINGLANLTVRQLAIGEENTDLAFSSGMGTGRGHLTADGELRVPARRLDDVVAEVGRSPTHLKVDVEGAELLMLRGAIQTLRRHRPVLFLSLRGAPHRDGCSRMLGELGYQLAPIGAVTCDHSYDVLARAA